MPKSDASVSLEKLIQRIADEKKMDPAQLVRIMNAIAYHETGGNNDSAIKQKGGGPGRGLFQFENSENGGAAVAVRRLRNYLEDNELEVPDWVTALAKNANVDASQLTAEQQGMLFLGYHRYHPKADFGAVKTDDDIRDFWANYHWAGSDGDREKRLKSFDSHFENFIKNGETFAYKAPVVQQTPEEFVTQKLDIVPPDMSTPPDATYVAPPPQVAPEQMFLGGMVNKGANMIGSAIGTPEAMKWANTIGSAAGTAVDIFTGNVPGAIANGADLVGDVSGQAGLAEKNPDLMKSIDGISGLAGMASGFFEGGGTIRQPILNRRQIPGMVPVPEIPKDTVPVDTVKEDMIKMYPKFDIYRQHKMTPIMRRPMQGGGLIPEHNAVPVDGQKVDGTMPIGAMEPMYGFTPFEPLSTLPEKGTYKKPFKPDQLPKGCVAGVCRDYAETNKLSETTFRQMNNMYGDAWTILDNSFGENIELNPKDYSNLKENDLVVMSRSPFKSDKAKGIPESNQHVGRISKIQNGVPYVKHYIGDTYYEEPINNINQKFAYTPSAVRRLPQFKDIQEGESTFKFDEGYKPNVIEAQFVEGSRQKPEIQKVLRLDSDEYDNLERLAYGIMGAESDFGRSKRTLYRMAVPDFIQKIVKAQYDNWRGQDVYDENLNNLSQGYSSTKESSLHGVSEDPAILKKIQAQVGVTPDGIYGPDTKAAIENWNKNNPNDPIEYRPVAERVKDGDYKGLDRTNNHLYYAMRELGLNPDNLENGTNSYKAVMATLSWFKKRYPNATDEELLKMYTGKKNISGYKQKVDKYLANIDQNKENNMQHSFMDELYGKLSAAHNFQNKTLKEAKSDALGFLRDNLPDFVPENAVQLMYDLAGGKKMVTEKNLADSTLQALKDVVKDALYKGKTTLEYPDYATGNDVNGSEVNPLKMLGDERYILKTLLGQATIRKIDDRTYEIIDTYDFNDQGKSFGIGDDLSKRGVAPYTLVRALGRNFGSADGQGAKVKIRITL